jgi:uncharacterized secreted protein with C-terminal beta-propeller domain
MSVKRPGARAGAAAFAVGLALSSAPGAGIAAAAPSEDDTSSVSAPKSGGPANPTRASGSGDAEQSPAPGRRATRRGLSPATDPAASAEPISARPLPAPRRTRPADSDPTANPAITGSLPQRASSTAAAAATSPVGPANLPSVFTPSVPTFTPAAAIASALPARTPARAVRATRTAQAATVRPAADPALAMGTMLAGFLTSSTNWVSGLPANPVSDLLEGALLLVRRTLITLFPALNPGQTTGQGATTATGAYYTDAELRDYLLGLAMQQYGSLFGQTVPVYGNGGPWPDYYYLKMDGVLPSTGITSGTNTQVNGVDEADFVETDGQYLYVAHNGQLQIVGTDLTVAYQTPLSGNVVGQFLAGDRLTVITQSGYGWYGTMVPMARMAWGPWWAIDPQTTVTVYDVTDRTAPTVVTQTMFDGRYQEARSVDGVVYLVLQRGLDLPAPSYTDTPVTPDALEPGDGQTVFMRPGRWEPTITAYRTYETWDQYVARVGDEIVGLSLPHAYTVDAEGNSVDLGVVAGAADIVRPHTGGAQSVLTLVSVDSTGSTGAAFADSVGALVASGNNTVYMTQGAMYVGTQEYQYTETGSSDNTRIDRFAIAGTQVAWQASGVVSGTLLNQFAMEEHDGYLNVATHTNASELINGTPSTRNDNGVYVLDTAGDTLDVVGSLTGLAPGEHLYAARFVGDTAYLVTFLQTDPLFAIDLSDPTAPTLLGELIIPGFSNYLQPVGEGLLLGIGQEREAGSWNTNVHATLFDVSDPTTLTEITRQFLTENTAWSSSDAQFDHHALLYSAEDGLLVVPVYASGYDPQTGVYRSEQLLKVMRVTASGIEVLGEIRTDQSVFRTVRIGDVLYAISDSSVTAYNISDLSLIGSSAAPAVV